jgi:YrbI family 3-deoxy-D-manno-octulosonate 8-phosphate phosphatase
MITLPPERELLRCVKLLVFDFDGVFTDNAVWVREDGVEMVRCSREDGMGIALLRKMGCGPELMVLSTERNPVVEARCRKLQLKVAQGVSDKAAKLRLWAQELGVTLDETGFVGNDINDRECLEIVGLPIVVADAHPSVASLGRLRTSSPGGNGAVREICDALLEVRQPARTG